MQSNRQKTLYWIPARASAGAPERARGRRKTRFRKHRAGTGRTPLSRKSGNKQWPEYPDGSGNS
jgi:hypothetical protein